MISKPNPKDKYDLICIGGGIMSATLALMTKIIDPDANIIIFERLKKVAQESTEAWNNSGTGHSAFCELNYTSQQKDGSIDISKAKQIFKQYEQSKQFWSYLLENNMLKNPKSFIHSLPHHSWVTGQDNVDFLKKRHAEMTKSFMFSAMKFSEKPDELENWFPLIMKDRNPSEAMAATRMELGTGVNFGNLTEQFFRILEEEYKVPILLDHEVLDIDPDGKNDWLVEVKYNKTGYKTYYDSQHVFIGAGGGALPLLQKVEIQEKEGYGGFPVRRER